MLSDRARVAGEKQRREEMRRGEKKGEKMRELRGGGRGKGVGWRERMLRGNCIEREGKSSKRGIDR